MERTLDERTINPDPIAQFRQWFDDAVKEKILLPEAMTLATASPDGRPSARVVLHKDVDTQGFVFYTNYNSRKGKVLSANPLAALVFYWEALRRQIRIEGAVRKVSPEESDRYFASRPRESQISALISPQGEVVSGRSELERLAREAETRYEGKPVPRPAHWGGYRLKPEKIEFWQGREARLHDRILYELQSDGSWRLSRLAP
jgi:pyridoxamine 5'-phosphate oxidase